jgi:iron(III) transport system permease protein
VGLGVAIVGVTTAWLTAMHDFPGRRIFEWALVLPLAVPAYVMAYVLPTSCNLSAPYRRPFGILRWRRGDYYFPDIRTLPGAMLMFVFVLYPYVYLLARTAFLERAGGVLELRAPWASGPGAFFTVSLPLARPAIAAGVALALMETLADYGTVAYFAVNTFTTGIYRAWFSLGDRVPRRSWRPSCSASCCCWWPSSASPAAAPATTTPPPAIALLGP